jgi:hypothetical protein
MADTRRRIAALLLAGWADNEPSMPVEPIDDYDQQVRAVIALCGEVVPADAVVAVVSRGDDRLLEIGGRDVWHFPADDNRSWAGFHPADDAHALDMLQVARGRGVDHLVIPEASRWWLDHYEGFSVHLREHHAVVADEVGVGAVVALSPDVDIGPKDPVAGGDEVAVMVAEILGDELVSVVGGAPEDDEGACRWLEGVRRSGVGYLVLPAQFRWWVVEYPQWWSAVGGLTVTVSHRDIASIFRLRDVGGDRESE